MQVKLEDPGLDAEEVAIEAGAQELEGDEPKEPAALSDEDRAAHETFLESIDDHDDCHRVYSA
ncbi:MAG: hypothetical protein R3F34_19330 [Planctomycetota bacterium]